MPEGGWEAGVVEAFPPNSPPALGVELLAPPVLPNRPPEEAVAAALSVALLAAPKSPPLDGVVEVPPNSPPPWVGVETVVPPNRPPDGFAASPADF